MKVLVGPARIWAGAVAPGPSASLSWSGVPTSITRSLGTTYGLSQHVEYDGEGILTYSSVGTSLSGTGISLDSSKGMLTIAEDASAGVVSGLQFRVSDGSLSDDTSTLSITKVDELLVYPESLVRVGAFRLPDSEDYAYGGGLAFNPAGNGGAGSLFVRGSSAGQSPFRVAEISIPTPVNSNSLGDLPRPTVLQALADPTNGTLAEIGSDYRALSGLVVDGGRLILSAYVSYGDTQNGSHWTRPLNLAATSDVIGPVSFDALNSAPWDPPSGTYGSRLYGGPMCEVPAPWREALGGSHLTGASGLSWIGKSSDGLLLASFSPDDLQAEDPIGCNVLMGFPVGREMQRLWGYSLPEANEHYQREDNQAAVFFAGDSVVVVGRHAMGVREYGTSAPAGSIVDPAFPSIQGEHAYPYRYQCWAIRAADLAAVKAGAKLHYEVKPYATWELVVPMYAMTGAEHVGLINGGAFDPATGRLWLSFHNHEGFGHAVVHVFDVELS